MYEKLRPWLFRLEAERAHRLTLGLLQAAASARLGRSLLRQVFAEGLPERPVEVFGLRFRNPLGVAAGYDKEGRAVRGLACLGFGHVEIGTVTALPQAGNPRPRLFRLVEDQALVNRMGFPNPGLEAARGSLFRSQGSGTVVGINIGKGKETPLESAAHDYARLLRGLGPRADFVTVNISSPNTLGLRALQGRAYLEGLLKVLAAARLEMGRPVPMLVKLAPDLAAGELQEAVDVIEAAGMDGIVAVNTTVARPNLRSALAAETGGLSGRPLFRQAVAVVERIVRQAQGRLPVVAVGGIDGVVSARAMMEAGAVLLQVYTGLVFRGPGLVREILQGLG